jgi:hypothetical protein
MVAGCKSLTYMPISRVNQFHIKCSPDWDTKSVEKDVYICGCLVIDGQLRITISSHERGTRMGTSQSDKLAWSWAHGPNQERRGPSVCRLSRAILIWSIGQMALTACLPSSQGPR